MGNFQKTTRYSVIEDLVKIVNVGYDLVKLLTTNPDIVVIDGLHQKLEEMGGVLSDEKRSFCDLLNIDPNCRIDNDRLRGVLWHNGEWYYTDKDGGIDRSIPSDSLLRNI